eukprot:g3601.t1
MDSDDDVMWGYSSDEEDGEDTHGQQYEEQQQPQEQLQEDFSREEQQQQPTPTQTPRDALVASPSSGQAMQTPRETPAASSSPATVVQGSGRSEFRVMTAVDIIHEQDSLIQSVEELLSLPRPISRALLLWSGWSKERLLDKYYQDEASASAKAGVTNAVRVAKNNIRSPSRPAPTPASSMPSCPICMAPSSTALPSLHCGHAFCGDCWASYLRFKVEEGPTCLFATCPRHDCDEVIPAEIFQELGSEETGSKYTALLAESYVDINRRIKWCPGASCDRAIRGTGAATSVECTCGTAFCFRCGHEHDHFPASCSDRAKWEERCSAEEGNANWILENTKKCPRCFTRIEKSQGCNKVGCKQCGYDFCWICCGPWSEHGNGNYYGCNKFKKKGKGKENVPVEENDEFLHHFKRYGAHKSALKFAEKHVREAKEKVSSLRRSGKASKWIDSGAFYVDAAQMVAQCRTMLMYSYVFAYYTLPEGSPEREVFSYLQSNLESNTEALSEMSEADIHETDRSALVNFTAVTKTLKNNMRQGVESGLASSVYTRILRFTGSNVGDQKVVVPSAPISKSKETKPVARIRSSSSGSGPAAVKMRNSKKTTKAATTTQRRKSKLTRQ